MAGYGHQFEFHKWSWNLCDHITAYSWLKNRMKLFLSLICEILIQTCISRSSLWHYILLVFRHSFNIFIGLCTWLIIIPRRNIWRIPFKCNLALKKHWVIQLRGVVVLSFTCLGNNFILNSLIFPTKSLMLQR